MEVVPVWATVVQLSGPLLGQLVIRLKATLSNQSLKQQGAVVPSSRLVARAVQGHLFFTLLALIQLSLRNSWQVNPLLELEVTRLLLPPEVDTISSN